MRFDDLKMIDPIVVEIVIRVDRNFGIELEVEILEMLMAVRDGAKTDVVKTIRRHIDILESVKVSDFQSHAWKWGFGQGSRSRLNQTGATCGDGSMEFSRFGRVDGFHAGDTWSVLLRAAGELLLLLLFLLMDPDFGRHIDRWVIHEGLENVTIQIVEDLLDGGQIFVETRAENVLNG